MNHTQALFQRIFPSSTPIHASAHGRVNLLGEHTDYNHGLVLPAHIPQNVQICMSIAKDAPNDDQSDVVSLLSMNEDMRTPAQPSGEKELSVFTRTTSEEQQNNWTDYVIGSLKEARTLLGSSLPALNVLVESTVPMGAGLSSSAALEIATLRAVQTVLQNAGHAVSWSDLEIAQMGQRAENNYVGMPCGLMDQLVISAGDAHSALFINFYDENNIQYEKVRLFSKDRAVFSVVYSGISHTLVSSGSGDDEGYKTRREQCERAAAQMGKSHLSACTYDDMKNASLEGVLLKRARHVVSENARVRGAVDALQNSDVEGFARYMNESHASQRDDFEVSIPEIDAMVEVACEHGAYGARLTGGGFGGSIIILSPLSAVKRIETEVKKRVASARFIATLGA